jgi:hypothetical protein
MNFRSKRNQEGNFLAGLGIVAILGYAALIIAFFYGYICNAIAIFSALNEPITGLFIARCIGVIAAPFGAILGYF